MSQTPSFQQKKPNDINKQDVYLILVNLIQKNSLDSVFTMLHNVATDLGHREKLESMFERAEKWDWKK